LARRRAPAIKTTNFLCDREAFRELSYPKLGNRCGGCGLNTRRAMVRRQVGCLRLGSGFGKALADILFTAALATPAPADELWTVQAANINGKAVCDAFAQGAVGRPPY
jgi:hypothetical protein